MPRLWKRFTRKWLRRGTRRSLMSWLTLTLLMLCFAGGTFLKLPLAGAPVVFLFYWSGVVLLTIALILTAGYDLHRVARELRREERVPGTPR